MTDENQEDENLEPSPGSKGRGHRLVLTQDEQEQVVRLAEIGCSVKEICYILGKPKSRDTLTKWYGDIIELGRSEGNARLRRVQFKKAVEDEDVKMLIWLGKQRLGQAEVIIDTAEPLPWSDDI